MCKECEFQTPFKDFNAKIHEPYADEMEEIDPMEV